MKKSVLKMETSIAGFLGYPIAVGDKSNCREVMEPGWNTSVTIRIPSYSIDGEQIPKSLNFGIFLIVH